MGSILYIIGAIVVIGWLLGVVLGHLGGLFHLVLVIAVVIFLIQFFTGKKVV